MISAKESESAMVVVYGRVYVSHLAGSVEAVQLRGNFNGKRSSVTVSRYAMIVGWRGVGSVHEDIPVALLMK